MDLAMDMGSWERPMKEGGTGIVKVLAGMVAVHMEESAGRDGGTRGGGGGGR